MNIDSLLAAAKKKIKNPDIIIDPYDLTYVWLSDKFCQLSDYTCAELIGKSSQTIEDFADQELREIETEMAYSQDKVPVESVLTKKDGSKIQIKGYGYSFTYQNDPYMVGKIVKTNEIT